MSSLDEVIRSWELNFMVERTASPKLLGNIFMQYGPHPRHSVWSISLDVKDFDQSAFCKLLERSAAAFSADFGLVHTITEAETPRGRAHGSIGFLDTAKTEKHLYVASPMIGKCVPDIYWTTVFGRPYLELFSRERLLSCPAHRIKELESGAIVIQLTPELKDIAAEEAAFERLRQDARNHLNNDAFFDPAKGLDYQYRVPAFVWGPILH
jgi:hypothetical protein